MGRWAERAKAAHVTRHAARDGHHPLPAAAGGDITTGVPAAPVATGRIVETPSSPSRSIRTAWVDTTRCDPRRGATPPRPEEKAQEVPASSPAPSSQGYLLVDSNDGLELVVDDLKGTTIVGLDLETTGVCWWRDRIRIVSISTESDKTYLVDAFEVDITPLFPALRDKMIVAHNALFDLLFLRRARFEPDECACTMVLSQILWAGKLKPGTENNIEHDLASVAKRTLGKHLDKTHQKDDWSGEITPEMLDYAAGDSKVLLPVYRELMRLIKETG